MKQTAGAGKATARKIDNVLQQVSWSLFSSASRGSNSKGNPSTGSLVWALRRNTKVYWIRWRSSASYRWRSLINWLEYCTITTKCSQICKNFLAEMANKISFDFWWIKKGYGQWTRPYPSDGTVCNPNPASLGPRIYEMRPTHLNGKNDTLALPLAPS